MDINYKVEIKTPAGKIKYFRIATQTIGQVRAATKIIFPLSEIISITEND